MIGGPIIKTVVGMIQAGLGRLVNYLMTQFKSVFARAGELSRRFPNAPADIIQSAIDIVRDMYGAARRLMGGQNPTIPRAPRPDAISSPGFYHYDVLIELKGPGTDRKAKMRLESINDSPLSIGELTDIAKKQAENEALRIQNLSPGQKIDGALDFGSLSVLSIWQD